MAKIKLTANSAHPIADGGEIIMEITGYVYPAELESRDHPGTPEEVEIIAAKATQGKEEELPEGWEEDAKAALREAWIDSYGEEADEYRDRDR